MLQPHAPARKLTPLEGYARLLRTLPSASKSQRPAILAATRNVLTIHQLLTKAPGGLDTQAVQERAGLARKHADRALHAGKHLGLWARTRLAHNRHLWRATPGAPCPFRQLPAGLAVLVAPAVGLPQYARLAAFSAVLFYWYKVVTEGGSIKRAWKEGKTVSFTPFLLKKESITPLASSSMLLKERGKTIPAGGKTAPSLSQPPPAPTNDPHAALQASADTQRTIRAWADAHRVAFCRAAHRPILPVGDWSNARLARDRRCWVRFAALAASCRAWGADVREVCLAAAEQAHRARCPVPPARMASAWGEAVWRRWREREADKAGDRPEWREGQVQARRAEVVDRDEALRARLRAAWREAEYDAWNAVCFAAGAEVLWTLGATEPAVADMVRQEAAGTLALAHTAAYRADGAERFAAEWRALQADPARQRRLLALRAEALGTAAPCLTASRPAPYSAAGRM